MMTLIYILIYVIGYPISVTLMHKFHKELDMDYNQPKTYVNHDDWDNNAQAFAGISVAWPFFWTTQILIFIAKKFVKFSAAIESHMNLDKVMLLAENEELKTKLETIQKENEELKINLEKPKFPEDRKAYTE